MLRISAKNCWTGFRKRWNLEYYGMPADREAYYNRVDIGIFLLYLEACMDHDNISFMRTLYPDTGDEEKTLVAIYQTQ